MAGPWLKMECATPDKPEVLAITAALGWDDPDLTVGKLFRLWRWFDQHTIDGNAARVTPALLDRIVGVTGFVQAVANERWLTVTVDGITLLNFDRHNGETAKQRAMTAKRVAEFKSNAKGNDEGNGVSVTSALPRGRGRGRDKEPSNDVSLAPQQRATKKCPDSFVITPELFDWAGTEAPGVNVRRETEKFRDHTFKTAYSDWAGAWRNWIRRAAEGAAKSSGGSAESFRERDQRLAAEQMRAWAPGIAAGTDRDQHIIEMESANVFALQSN